MPFGAMRHTCPRPLATSAGSNGWCPFARLSEPPKHGDVIVGMAVSGARQRTATRDRCGYEHTIMLTGSNGLRGMLAAEGNFAVAVPTSVLPIRWRMPLRYNTVLLNRAPYRPLVRILGLCSTVLHEDTFVSSFPCEISSYPYQTPQ